MKQQQTARETWALALGTVSNREADIAAEALPLLVALLRLEQPAEHETTASALRKLASQSQGLDNKEKQLLLVEASCTRASTGFAEPLQVAIRMASLQHTLCLCWLPCGGQVRQVCNR